MSTVNSQPLNTFIEFDWTNEAAGRLAVDRNSFTPSTAAIQAISAAHTAAGTMLKEFAENTQDSITSLINLQLARSVPAQLTLRPWWLRSGKVNTAPSIAPLRFPAIDANHWNIEDNCTLRWRGEAVTVVPGMGFGNQIFGGDQFSWHARLFSPQFIALGGRPGEGYRPVPVWEELQGDQGADDPFSCPYPRFPPGWRTLLGIRVGQSWSMDARNPEHPLIERLSDEADVWARHTFELDQDPLPHRDRVLSSASYAAAWIVTCIEMTEKFLWAELADREDGLLGEVWDVAEVLDRDDEILYWWETGRTIALFIVTRSAWHEYRDREGVMEFERRFGSTPTGWRLAVPDDASSGEASSERA
jgi:hypothetical protein